MDWVSTIPSALIQEALTDISREAMQLAVGFRESASAMAKLAAAVVREYRRQILKKWAQLAVEAFDAGGTTHAEQLLYVFARQGAGAKAAEIVFDLVDMGLLEKTEDGRLAGRDLCSFCLYRKLSRDNVREAGKRFLPIVDNCPRVECKHHTGYGYRTDGTVKTCPKFKEAA